MACKQPLQEHRCGLEHDETQIKRDWSFAELDGIGAWRWVQARAGSGGAVAGAVYGCFGKKLSGGAV